jgi:hypothetical protein
VTRHVLILTLFLASAPAAAQEPALEADNPLAALNEQLKAVLADAEVPFSGNQERSIALMMEERRRASEELFGDLMDFRGGPTSGQDTDRLRSAIEWMRTEYIRLLRDHLTMEQSEVWERFLETSAASALEALAGADAPPAQTQYVRINNNAFTSEFLNFNSNQGTEVFERGGAGAWHGNAQFLLKDDALNARNAFAGNKPPYQERRLSMDASGPVIRGRLTSGASFTQVESKNVDTVRATLPEGIYALGITRPNTFREISSRSTLQLADAHALRIFGRYATESAEDQGIGGFTLPERASTSAWRAWNAELRHFATLSSRSIAEARLQLSGNRNVTIPANESVRINVLDAFNRGGAQNRSNDTQRSQQLNAVFTRLGDVVTMKAGLFAANRLEQSVSTNNFGGTFTFSSLDAFLAGMPATYRVNRGNPLVDTRQFETSQFLQTDVKVNRQLMLMFGARYDWQTNLDDNNNLSPRFGFAYSPGQATVIRGGTGVFYSRLGIGMVERQRRFDGTRQFEVVIDNPSYPDPFAAGTLRQTFPSVRVTDPLLEAPYFATAMLSVERTFFSTLLVSASYDFQREYGRFRTRDLNAPENTATPGLDSCQAGDPAEACLRPDPGRGNVISLESKGREVRHNVRLNARQRFSIFNVSGNYQMQRAYGDVQGSPGALATDSYNPTADWGPAPFPRHQFNGSVNARLPLGVFATGSLRANSGRRYTITTGFDDNRDSNVDDRPAGVRPNSLVGPKYVNVDLNLSKAFFLARAGTAGSGKNVNVFVNMTNAFNHVHYGTPSGVMTSPNFGRSTSASDPREIEVGVRFQF